MSQAKLVIGNKNYSSWSLRAWLALKRVGIPFDEIVIPLGTPETRAAILTHSPSGKVPVLKLGKNIVWDSLAIGEYLAERFPEAGLWPSDPARRAEARSITAEMHAGFAALRAGMPMNMRATHPNFLPSPQIVEDIRRIEGIWKSCRERFADDGPYLFGGFCLADAFHAPVVSRFRTYEITLAPAAQAFADTIWNLSDFQEWLAAAKSESHTIARYET